MLIMKKSITAIFLISFFVLSLFCGNRDENLNALGKDSTENSKQKNVKESKERNIPAGLKKLMLAYPDYIDSVDENHLYWKDGEKMIYDDGQDKTFEDRLNDPDLEDMMWQEYNAGKEYETPGKDFDPGRIRYEPFFFKIYGSSASEVKSNMVTISWMPKSTNAKVSIMGINDVDVQLKAVSDELDKLPENLKKYVTKTAGTFYWRNIAGTNRLSTHSFGIAIDINTDYSDYWMWDKSMKYKNRIPLEIVDIFEKYGFIWGGKWYHYDTMHFEYRPELLVYIE
jgi:hypothetical protein